MLIKSVTDRRRKEATQKAGHICVKYKNRALVWGGSCPTGANQELLIYNPAKKCFSSKQHKGAVPLPPYCLTGCIIGDKFYVVNDYRTIYNILNYLDLKTMTWYAMENIKGIGSIPSLGSVSWTYNSKMYIFGGKGLLHNENFNQLRERQPSLEIIDFEDDGHGYSNQFVEYDPVENQWDWPRYTGQCPSARSNADGALIGHKYYMFGGECETGHSDEIYCLDMRTKVWSKIVPKDDQERPSARAAMSFTQISSDSIVLYGGCSIMGPLDDCWLFNINEVSWEKVILPFKQPRWFHRGVRCSENETIIHGGFSTAMGDYCKDLITLRVSPTSLKRIAGDTIQSNRRRIDQLSINDLPLSLRSMIIGDR